MRKSEVKSGYRNVSKNKRTVKEIFRRIKKESNRQTFVEGRKKKNEIGKTLLKS